VDQIVCTAAPLSPIFRFWSPVFNGHFFTISESEKDNIVANLSRDWSYEGVAYHAYPILAPSTVPLYRFWSNRYKHHFFTMDEPEKNNIIANSVRRLELRRHRLLRAVRARGQSVRGVAGRRICRG